MRNSLINKENDTTQSNSMMCRKESLLSKDPILTFFFFVELRYYSKKGKKMQSKQRFSRMRKRSRRSNVFQVVFFALFAPTILSQDGIVGTCVRTIDELNNEMQLEQQRIAEGGTPEGSYTYILCSDTFFDATNATLVPLLDNIMFMCGDDGDRLNNCVILGGTEQVQIQNSNLTGYAINQIGFMGITFAGFEKTDTRQGTSITASASASTVVKFTNTAWQVRNMMGTSHNEIRRLNKN